MVFAHFIGHPLIPLNFMQQRREADFRFAIARVTDQAEPVALMGGEAVERGELRHRFKALVRNWVTLVFRQNRLNCFVFGYYHVSTVLPTLLVTPAYLVGAIPLGVLMKATFAFQKVEGRSPLHLLCQDRRVEGLPRPRRALDAAMARMDQPDPRSPTLEVAPGGPRLVGQGSGVAAAERRADRVGAGFQAGAGQRLLVGGPSGTGKSSLFRALAGIWPLGEGAIRLPAGARVLALPQRPYFPLGTLRQGLTYPLPSAAVEEPQVRAAMASAGLGHLAERLDEEADWATALSGGEQQRVGFARALINQPTVLLLDEAVSTLEDAEVRELYRMLSEQLPAAIVISIGRAAALAGLHHRSIEMTGSPATGGTRDPGALAAVPA
jgi:putative ATP-binding cassette transporter